ncbi:type II secretion system protein N [Hyphococcus flavus]|uniref:Type II secretion system protein N n=1 Tax=Hyphococcus flavus TaxID=1866326 RepID=A0AAF0CEH1_9PROT|nr:type II secretion system protein N [Hyphococcus flavus]WDI31241.1 type II secretion system protein N [Hyphococcus flavus]
MTVKSNHELISRLWILLGVLSFLVTVLSQIPASVFAMFVDEDRTGLAYSNVTGTIWNGAIERLSINGVLIGQVNFKMSPISIAMLSPRVRLSARDGAVLGKGAVSVGFGSRVSFSDVHAQIDLNAVAPTGILGRPAQGIAEVSIDRLTFSQRHGCQNAQGSVWTNVLNAPARRYELPDLPLSGDMQCEEQALLVAVSGNNDRAGVDLLVRVQPDLTYEVSAVARPSEAELASALRLFGFEGDADTMTYGAAGVFKGPGT